MPMQTNRGAKRAWFVQWVLVVVGRIDFVHAPKELFELASGFVGRGRLRCGKVLLELTRDPLNSGGRWVSGRRTGRSIHFLRQQPAVEQSVPNRAARYPQEAHYEEAEASNERGNQQPKQPPHEKELPKGGDQYQADYNNQECHEP